MALRRRNARILRLTATLLAVTLAIGGLLGHGLAMLAVSLLTQPPAAAQPGFPAFIEICAADGLTRVVASELPTSGMAGGEDGKPAAPASGKINGCPVCSAFAQSGPADLPAALALAHPETGAGDLPATHQIAAPAPGRLLALSRGPPAA